jgi:predicted DNA-binding protein (UPF0251 family)
MAPRSKLHRKIGSPPVLKGYKPIGLPYNETHTTSILYEEIEALRLADYTGLKQEEAARLMNVSRPTFTRIYSACLKKLAKAFTEGRSIVIEGGNVEFDKQWYRCNDCTTVFHHSEKNQNECIHCKSEDIEHINESVRIWKDKKERVEKKDKQEIYCSCPNCHYKVQHQQGVPCFSLSCPECSIPLVRENV